MDDKLTKFLQAKADPEIILASLPAPEVWRFSSALVALCGFRAAVEKRRDIEAVCARFIDDLADLTGLPKMPKLGEKDDA